jgi:hypothetical protein
MRFSLSIPRRPRDQTAPKWSAKRSWFWSNMAGQRLWLHFCSRSDTSVCCATESVLRYWLPLRVTGSFDRSCAIPVASETRSFGSEINSSSNEPTIKHKRGGLAAPHSSIEFRCLRILRRRIAMVSARKVGRRVADLEGAEDLEPQSFFRCLSAAVYCPVRPEASVHVSRYLTNK